jgi:uncharacterized membrane protein YfcA
VVLWKCYSHSIDLFLERPTIRVRPFWFPVLISPIELDYSVISVTLLLLAGLIGGFINTLAGGGSMLTLPALMMLGIPADIANATNRVGVFLQSAAAVRGFKNYDRLDSAAILPMMVPTVAGALIGSLLASFLPVSFLKPTLLITMVLMAVYMIVKPDGISPPEGTRAFGVFEKPSGLVALFVAGVYGGFVQAGVGFILIAALAGSLRYDLVRANALKMVATGIFSIVALTVFIWRDQVMWVPGLILAAGTMIGASLSVKFAVNVSQSTLKWLLLVMVTLTCTGAFFFG